MIRAAAARLWGQRWAWLLTAALGTAYVLLETPSTDLAGQAYRASLFESAGLTLWDNGWFAGYHPLAYSVIAPPLMALLGVHLTAALAATGAAAAFERLAAARWPGRAGLLAAVAFALAVGAHLWTGRVTFLLGAAAGLAALLAASRGRPVIATALAACTTLASPVAGVFLGLAGVALALARRRDKGERTRGLALVAGAAAPALLLAIAFPSSGSAPFSATSFWPALAATATIFALLPREARTLRIGALLYALLLVVAFAVPNPLGHTATRLGALTALPFVATLGWHGSRRRLLLGALALAFTWWALYPPVRDALRAADDPAATEEFHTPLIEALENRSEIGARVEVVPTAVHGEARFVAPEIPLARGLSRQLDTELNGLFYDDPLTHATYERWLLEHAVSHVAVPHAPLDESGEDEGRLVEDEPDYLEPVWSSPDWSLFAVRAARPLVSPEGGGAVALEQLDADSFSVRFDAPGAAVVRVRWNRYWRAEGGCVEPAGEWTRVESARAGVVEVASSFSPDRVASEARRCD